jgi:hypothetical protein
MQRFMLLIRGGDEAFQYFTPDQFQQAMQRYYDWAAQLRREGRLQGADELKNGGQVVRVRDGEVIVDGPYSETKESVGGYFLIEARDEAEATEVAKGCPALLHGGLVEVREINENP